MLGNTGDRFKKRSLTASIILLLVVLFSSITVVVYIKYCNARQCYEKIQRVTDFTIKSIEDELYVDTSQMKFVSRLISMSDEDLHSPTIRQHLNSYKVRSVFSDIAILTPGNKVITASGKELDANGVLDYDQVHLNGEHVSTLQPDLDVEGQYNIRNYVKIKRNGKIIAFLYTTFIPDDIIKAWVPDFYEGDSKVMIVDRETGMIILDEDGKMLQNIEDVNFNIQSSSVNLDNGTFNEALLRAQKGYAVGKDPKTLQTMYYGFKPMKVQKWELVISVPEEAVFRESESTRRALMIFLIFEVGMLAIYFLYIVRLATHSVEKVERRAAIDVLTGLQNRNRFEYFCSHWTQEQGNMACIYIDVNGLHEINNSKGHLLGDEMLKVISNIIADEFGKDNTYRIGGDEFVAFKPNANEAMVRDQIFNVESIIEFAGYHIAAGMSIASEDKPLLTAMKEAEKEMYDNKKKYYESIGKKMR